MVQFLAIAVLLSVMGQALADGSQGSSMTLNGIAPAMCTFGAAETTGAANMTLAQNAASASMIQIAQLLDPATARIQPAAIHLRYTAQCNHPHSLSFGSLRGGLVPAVPGTGDAAFAHRVDYTARVSWGAVSSEITTSGVSGAQRAPQFVSGAYAGQLTLDITIPGSETRAVAAGTYSDILVLTLGARL